MRPITLHVIFDLPQIEMRFPCFAENGSNAGRAGLGDLNENALVFMADHVARLVILYCSFLLSRPRWAVKIRPKVSHAASELKNLASIRK